jgi:hypothetical protein
MAGGLGGTQRLEAVFGLLDSPSGSVNYFRVVVPFESRQEEPPEALPGLSMTQLSLH